MDCAAQAADIISTIEMTSSFQILDVGCGAGHFIHSLKKRFRRFHYYGLDYSPSIVEIGKKAYSSLGLDPERVFLQSIDDLTGLKLDIVLIMNVLSFNPDFRRPLYRASETEAQAILIRDNFGEKTTMRWELDGHLDERYNHLMGYWNEWSRSEMADFLRSLGYSKVDFIEDRRTKGAVELVVGKPYHWEFLLAQK
jgi:SAM-dependent methyltransferase